MRALTQQGLMIEIGGISLDYDLSQISGVDFLEEGETKEGVFEYIEALNLIIADDIRDEDAKEAEVMHLRLNDKPWHGYLVSEEARDLVARHRREMEALKPPSLCGKLRELYIKWMLLREAKHNAFYHLNWDQAESFQAQITEHAAKINEELARIKWLLGDEEVKRIQEFIRQTEQDRRSAEGGIEKDE